MFEPEAAQQRSRTCILVGNKASGKSFLASTLPQSIDVIESSDLLLRQLQMGEFPHHNISASEQRKRLDGRARVSDLSNTRRSLAEFIRTKTAKGIGEMQSSVLRDAARPTILVGVRYADTVSVLRQAGHCIVFIDSSPVEQTRRLAGIFGLDFAEAKSIIDEEWSTCELELCRHQADIILRNSYDNRSLALAQKVLLTILA